MFLFSKELQSYLGRIGAPAGNIVRSLSESHRVLVNFSLRDVEAVFLPSYFITIIVRERMTPSATSRQT